MKLPVSTFVLFTAHHVAAQVFEVKKPGFDRRAGLPITTAQPVSCTQVVESLEAGEPTPPIELDWEIEMATTDAAHCSVTMRSSATAAYASYVSEHAAWWSGLPKRAENIHDLCGKPKMFVDAIPTYFACDGPQTVFVKENPAESTVLSVSERVLDLVMFAEPATTGSTSQSHSTLPAASTPSTTSGPSATSSHSTATSPSATKTPSVACKNGILLFTSVFTCAWAMFAIAL